MQRLSAKQRLDSRVAGTVIESVFDGVPSGSKLSYLKFLASSIDSLSASHPDRWGASLFSWGMRLNAGLVNCLVLSRTGVYVLVYKKAAPSGTKFQTSRYKNAPGCGITKVSLIDVAGVLPSLSKSHHRAISIAAGRVPFKSIREAHSAGITGLLSHLLQRTVPNPAYSTMARLHLINGGYGNGDKVFLERVARGSRRARSWLFQGTRRLGMRS